MNSEKRQIAAVLKELQKHERQQNIKVQREELIKAIAETTGEPVELVREKFREVQIRRESFLGVCWVFGIVAAIMAFALGVAILTSS